MAPSARPENVLQRAKELEAMDKGSAALDALYETVLSKRARSMTLQQLEPVFLKFVDLAVELRKGKIVKDGLHQYKKLLLAPATTQGDQGVEALENAVDRLLSLSEERVTRAQQQAEEVTVDDDLEEEKSPQDILLAMVSSEEAKDRTDREVVTPWLKFLWENYRSVLDVLRNNSKLESNYASVVQKAFAFCVQYNRKTEFRRLSELLRTHLQYAAAQSKAYHADLVAARAAALKQSGSKDVSAAQIAAQMPQNAPAHPIDLSDGDTLQRFLDTRFEQLNVAVKLELWQEAFRSVEDIHTLLSATRRPIPVGSMATYYETLARIFAVSNNHLFHAATWFRYYAMVHTRRGPSAELRRIASFFLLSVLCIPHNEQTALTGRARRWMALINLQRFPSRQSLLDAALQRNVLDYASPELVELYTLLETPQFEPLTLRDDIAALAPKLAAEDAYKPYFKPLFNVVATSVFDELAKSYSEAKLPFVLGLVSLPEPFAASKSEIERVLVQGSTQQGYRVRVDHVTDTVRFVDSLASPLPDTAGALLREEVWALAKTLAQVLGSAPKTVHGDFAAESREFAARKERERVRFEKREEQRTKLEEEQARERARKSEEMRAATDERLAREEAERAAALLKKETAEIALAEKRKLAESINAKGHLHVDLDDLENITTEQLQSMQVEQLDQEARGLEQRMASVARRYDHIERALRREEAKLWREDAETQATRDRETYEKRREAIITGARRTHEAGLAYAERFTRVRGAYTEYIGSVKSRHEQHVAEQRAKNAEALEQAKQQRIAEEKARQEREAEERAKAEREAAERKAAEEKAASERAAEWQRPSAPAPSAAPSSGPGAYVPVWKRAGGASAPAPAARGASPFGNASPGAPATGATAARGASPFGSAKPGAPATGQPSPAARGASPFGAATPGAPASGAAPRASPFGGARPGAPAGGAPASPAAGAKPSPFGVAKAGAPATGAPAKGANPFGGAQPKPTKDTTTTNTPAANASSSGGKYVPPWLRGKQ